MWEQFPDESDRNQNPEPVVWILQNKNRKRLKYKCPEKLWETTYRRIKD